MARIGTNVRVDAPLGRIPRSDRCRIRFEFSLDAGPLQSTGYSGKPNSGVLIDLAEQILAVNQLKSSSPQRFEFQLSFRKLRFLIICYPAKNLFLRPCPEIGKALVDT